MYLTRRQVLDLVQVTEKTLRKLIEAGTIPAPFKIGGSDRWEASEVEAAIEKTRNTEKQP